MIIKEIKPIKQKIGMCGPTCLEIIFKYYNKNYSQKLLKKLTQATVFKGTSNKKMIQAIQILKFKGEFKTNSSIDEIRKLISNKIPPIIAWITPEGGDHFSIISRINTKYIYILDPKPNKIRKFKIEEFEKRWLNINIEKNSSLKMLSIYIKLFLNNKINKKNNYILPIKKEEIEHKSIIIIKPQK